VLVICRDGKAGQPAPHRPAPQNAGRVSSPRVMDAGWIFYPVSHKGQPAGLRAIPHSFFLLARSSRARSSSGAKGGNGCNLVLIA